MEEKLGLFIHPSFETWVQPFEDKYQMVDFVTIGDPAFAKNKTKKEEGRHCLFCNHSFPKVRFKKAAHLLSRMIGNTDLYSTFECDVCNGKFSLYETDLSYFLGVGRSITGMNEIRKTPGFPGIDLKAKSLIYKGKKLLVIHKENAEQNIHEGTTKLKYLKPTYTPANVYKLFLKCALSVLPQEEVVCDYQLALEHLQGEKVLIGSHISVFRFPLSVKMPLHVYIFRKKSPTDKLPTYIASFYFDNLVITLPVLLHRDDLQFLNQPIQLPVAPPYFPYGNAVANIIPSFSTYDLSSPDKLKYEQEEMTMQIDPSELKKTTRFDPETSEETQTIYNPSGSKFFIVTEEGTTFTKEELRELLQKIEEEFSNKG